MLGKTLALLHHSLQTDTRLLRQHLYRLAFVAIIYIGAFIAFLKSWLVGAAGMLLFGEITWLNFAFISLAGISFFATAITEEKEEQTLPLLRMAGIGPAALLLGKSTSRLIIAGLLLSLQFPFTLLAVTLGGVTLRQVVAVYLSLLAYTVMTANMALFCSVACSRSGRATVMMLVLLGLLVVMPWFLLLIGPASLGSALPQLAGAFETIGEPRYQFSVIDRLRTIMDSRFRGGPLSFQVASNTVLGVVFFLLSWLLFDRFTIHRETSEERRGFLLRPTGRFQWLGPRRAWANPLMWKDFHFVTGGKPALLGKTVLYGLLAGCVALLVLAGNPSSAPTTLSVGTACISVALLIESSLYAGRLFRDEVRANMLPNLSLLPRKMSAIAYAKVAGCLLGLLPALLFLGLGMTCAAVVTLTQAYQQSLAESAFVSMFLLVVGGGTGLAAGLFFVHLVAYLSLMVKWGSVPLAIAVWLVCFVLSTCIMQILSAMAYASGIVVLQLLIGHRLRQLAAQ